MGKDDQQPGNAPVISVMKIISKIKLLSSF